MKILTLNLREINNDGECFSSKSIKVDITNEINIFNVLMATYLAAEKDIEKYYIAQELAEKRYMADKNIN